jgi:hypothetical protein
MCQKKVTKSAKNTIFARGAILLRNATLSDLCMAQSIWEAEVLSWDEFINIFEFFLDVTLSSAHFRNLRFESLRHGSQPGRIERNCTVDIGGPNLSLIKSLKRTKEMKRNIL